MRHATNSRRTASFLVAAVAALGAAFFCFFGAAPRPAFAQSEAELDGLVKDQRAARARVKALREKMERLASKLEREGRGYAASLLANAIQELDKSQLEGRMENVAAELRESGTLHRSLKLQDEILGNLETLLQILQDRKSLDKIDQILEEMQKALADVDAMKKDEEKLLAETRDSQRQDRESKASSSTADPTLAELAKKLADLATRQDELREETEKRVSDALRDAEAAQASLAALKAAQQKALERTRSGGANAAQGQDQPRSGESTEKPSPNGAEPRPAGETTPPRAGGEEAGKDPAKSGEGRPQTTPPGGEGEKSSGSKPSGESAEMSASAGTAELQAAIEALKERLDDARERTAATAEGKPAADGSDPATGLHGELKSIAEAARAEAAKAAAAAETSSASASAGAKDPLESAAESLESAAESVASEDAETAGEREKEAAAALDEALQALATPTGAGASPRSEMSRELRSLRAQATALGEKLLESSQSEGSTGESSSSSQSPSPSSEFAKASEQMDKAAESLGQAQGKTSTGDDPASAAAQEEALARTEAAEQAIGELLKRLEAKAAEDLAAAAKAEKDLEAAARAAAEEARRASAASAAKSPESSQSGQQSASEAETAASEMAQASQSMAQGEASQASKSQEKASQALRRAAEKAAEAAAGPMSEETKERLRRLQKRQEEIAAKAKELEERTKSLPNSAGRENVSRAKESMQKAGQSLERGETAKAIEKEDEALKYLNEAQRDIEQRRQEYRNLEQEEILFRVKEKIDALITKQRDINIRTLEADVRREQQGGAFTRAQKIKDIPNLSTDQKQVKTDVGEVSGKLRAEGSPAFTWVLDMVSDDSEAVAERLLAQDLGEGTRDIQSDVVSRLVSLSEAFKDELQRRQAEQGDQGGSQGEPPGGQGGQGQQDQRLVPLMTELKMLRHMQLEVLRKRADLVQRIQRSNEDELTRDEEALLSRLASQQGAVNEVFKSFKKLVGVE